MPTSNSEPSGNSKSSLAIQSGLVIAVFHAPTNTQLALLPARSLLIFFTPYC